MQIIMIMKSLYQVIEFYVRIEVEIWEVYIDTKWWEKETMREQ